MLTLRRKGFTLVELSIVLVIIGLLIGGILAAQSMILSAQINAQIKQLDQFNIGVANFQTKYNYLPGDAPNFDVAGDGNGLIQNALMKATPGLDSTTDYEGEPANFWRHLQQGGFLINEYPTLFLNSGGIRVGTKVPYAKTGDKKTGIALVINTLIYKNYFYIANFESLTSSNYQSTNLNLNPTVSVNQISAIDYKIDDGVPFSASISTYSGYVLTSAATSSCYNTGTTPYSYNLSNDNAKCIMYVAMERVK